MRKLFEEIGGEETCARLSDSFHDRVERDPVLRPLFPCDFQPQKERLAWFLAQELGGPARYREQRGKTSLGCRHAHILIGPREVEAWLGHMLAAVEELGLPEEVSGRLRSYFKQTAPTLSDPLLPYYDLSIRELADLLSKRPELARACDLGRTLLAHAAGRWDVMRVELLLRHGADTRARDLGNHDAMYRAANARIPWRESDGIAVVDLLLRHGAEVNGVSGPKRVTALHMAARRGTVEVAKALIAAGADLSAKDSKGVTPLGRAINCRQSEMVRFLAKAEEQPR